METIFDINVKQFKKQIAKLNHKIIDREGKIRSLKKSLRTISSNPSIEACFGNEKPNLQRKIEQLNSEIFQMQEKIETLYEHIYHQLRERDKSEV